MRTPEQLALPGRSVVLTFDDGPNGDVTAKLLDVLRERGVKAAFCPVGRQVIEQPELVRRMDREGHLIVNHTDSHGPMWLVSRSVLVEQMDQSDRAVGEALGRPDWKSRFFRPPWGFITPGLGKVLRERGMGLMPITYYAGDAAAGPSGARRVIEKTLRNARRNGGGVYVLHDGRHRLLPWPRFMAGWHRSGYNRSWVPGAAAEIIDTLRGEGFTILGAPEFFDSKNR
ncbi:polysaccharide deacetylase family protein [bacterium]|nr:polysaccharide deacetylase family protein [bacterium]